MEVAKAGIIPTKFNKETDNDEHSIDWSGKTQNNGGTQISAMNISSSDTPFQSGLISILLTHLCQTTNDGAILVFLPGLQEILAVRKLLIEKSILGENFNDEAKYKIFTLHSAIPQMHQDVFTKLDTTVRKIILSTNIAETSVTIPEVVYVIDSGKHREKLYDPLRRITSLVQTWISSSNARQR